MRGYLYSGSDADASDTIEQTITLHPFAQLVDEKRCSRYSAMKRCDMELKHANKFLAQADPAAFPTFSPFDGQEAFIQIQILYS